MGAEGTIKPLLLHSDRSEIPSGNGTATTVAQLIGELDRRLIGSGGLVEPAESPKTLACFAKALHCHPCGTAASEPLKMCPSLIEMTLLAHLPASRPAGYSRLMNATLTLDDDVAALLERAREKRGWSLEELGNELLRRTLRQLSASFKQPEPAAPSDASPLEAQIDELYDEIRDLVVRSAEDPGLKTEIEHKREKLRSLQAEEAAAWRQRADARLHLKPGDGYRLLERAARLLDT